ncbi:RsmE family RNA methyltransferase [Paraflavisolibacter sp. H34]|uniref:RsmE family RNA methyltransferase n=1 Tax=Huijunlia imazamoxiresistens TaxID=3127457 RepID=UPI003017CA0E
MALPYFYVPTLPSANESLVLDEETSKHVTQVLRMKVEEELMLTDGSGVKGKAVITDDHRKRCTVNVLSVEREEEHRPRVTIAISLVKNTSRFEWFLEKATEIGVHAIIPLLCDRTEKEKFRHDRLHQIIVSAMLQSQQCWLPLLHQPTEFQSLLQANEAPQTFIAHCLPEQKLSLAQEAKAVAADSIILIGPEGDFTPAEIEAALQKGYAPVSLGRTRLRTETAGIVAATLLCNRD